MRMYHGARLANPNPAAIHTARAAVRPATSATMNITNSRVDRTNFHDRRVIRSAMNATPNSTGLARIESQGEEVDQGIEEHASHADGRDPHLG